VRLSGEIKGLIRQCSPVRVRGSNDLWVVVSITREYAVVCADDTRDDLGPRWRAEPLEGLELDIQHPQGQAHAALWVDDHGLWLDEEFRVVQDALWGHHVDIGALKSMVLRVWEEVR
jgi:hypothetical protein